jgi:type IV pilus assembly protein PilB
MDLNRPPKLRSGRAKQDAGGGELPRSFPVNELAELVADLIETTGLVPADKLALVRGRAKQGIRFSQAVLDEGVASPEGIARTMASRFQMPFVDLAVTNVEEEAANQLALHVLERVVALPYELDGNVLRVAVADPGNVQAIDELRLGTRLQLELAVASRDDIMGEIRRLIRASEAFGARAVLDEEEGLDEGEQEADDLEVDDGISDVPLVRLVNSIIFQAAEDGASDIHFEPQEDSLVVRLRIDGVLHEAQRIPKRMLAGVTTRLKVLAKLDIAERRKPQDGRISLNAAAAGRMLDIRVATLPTVEGESVVMRLLDKTKRAPTLAELGLSDEMRVKLEEIIRRRPARSCRRADRLG